MVPQVRLETVTSVEGVAALQTDYEHLEGITGNKLPFALHEWHLTWCRHFLGCQSHVHDEPLFYVLRNAADKCVAIVPLIVSRRRLGPFKIVSIGLLGPDPAITEIRGPIIERGFEYMAARAVRDGLAKVYDWDWIHWSGLSEEFAEALGAGGAEHAAHNQVAPGRAQPERRVSLLLAKCERHHTVP